MNKFYQISANKRDNYIKSSGLDVKIEGKKGNQFFMNMCERYILKSEDILEIGTGTGVVPFWLGSLNKKMICLDSSINMLKIAKKNCQNYPKINFLFGNLNKITFKSNSFDLVIKRLAPDNIKEMRRVLKNGGYFLNLTNGEEDAIELKNIFNLPKHESVQDFNIKLEKNNLLLKKGREFKFFEIYKTYEQLKKMLEIAPIVPVALLNKKKNIDQLKKIFYNSKEFILTRHKYVTGAIKTA